MSLPPVPHPQADTANMFLPSPATTGNASISFEPFGMLVFDSSGSEPHPSFQQTVAPAASSQKFYTIERISDGIAGGHRHTLEDSDRVKKNSVQRWLLNKDRQEKKTLVSVEYFLIYAMFNKRKGKMPVTCKKRELIEQKVSVGFPHIHTYIRHDAWISGNRSSSFPYIYLPQCIWIYFCVFLSS